LGHECSFIVFVVCCVGSEPWDELITRSEESFRVGVSKGVPSRNLNNEVA